MTLEELKAKKIHITVDKVITVGDDIEDDILEYFLSEQADKNNSDKENMQFFIELYYGMTDIPDILDYSDYKVQCINNEQNSDN